MARNFKKLHVWQISYNLALEIYKVTDKFPEHEKNNLISQMRRASTSISLNIAEGCTRFTKKAYLQFLGYAYGSARELEVLLMFAKDLGYVPTQEYNNLNERLETLSKKLFVFIKKVESEKFFNWFNKKINF